MPDKTKIEWATDTWNPVTGCHKVMGIDWSIVGGESGPNARPMHPDWVRSLVEQCRASSVSVFVKQDSGPRSGMQGRLPDDLWVMKEFPTTWRSDDDGTGHRTVV